VTVNNYGPQRPAIRKEFLPDPEQIVFRLLVQRHAGPDARMDEHIVANPYTEIELLQEFEVLFGQNSIQLV
jgi:hypothetical protein